VIVNNNDWLAQLNYLEFLKDYGRHFSINRMLSFESVKLRLAREHSLSFLEFNYMILQGYDFLELYRRYTCILQLGGSDQWGNIVNGVELTRRIEHEPVFGLTSPLITTSTGEKMGKTVGGAIWLNADMLSAYDFWQYWRNTHDTDVGRFLRIFTDLPISDIERLETLRDNDINEAKKILADYTTALAHGDDVLPAINGKIKQLFESAHADISQLPCESIHENECPIALDELCVRFQLTTSKGEAKRLIQGGGLRLNDNVITDVKAVIAVNDFTHKGRLKLSAGKKKHVIIRLDT
jgi:tyrosyl-tRNA synthetase